MSKCPAALGERWVSLRSKIHGDVAEAKCIEGTWVVKLRMQDHRIRWVTCGANGILGYRRMTS